MLKFTFWSRPNNQTESVTTELSANSPQEVREWAKTHNVTITSAIHLRGPIKAVTTSKMLKLNGNPRQSKACRKWLMDNAQYSVHSCEGHIYEVCTQFGVLRLEQGVGVGGKELVKLIHN